TGGRRVDLLLDFAGLADRLGRLLADSAAVAEGDELVDEFLVAAGLQQVLDDHLHRDVFSLAQVAKHLPSVMEPRVGSALARVASTVRAGAARGRAMRRGEQVVV